MDDLQARVVALLAASRLPALCTSCIASALRAELLEVRHAVSSLRTDRLVDEGDRCRGCGTLNGFHQVVARQGLDRQAA